MNELYQLKEQAKSHRQSGQLEEALSIYQKLWGNSQDKYDGVGLLHCLRKLKRFDEAIPLARELEKKHLDLNWCRIEIIWTYIGGFLNQLTEKDSLSKTLNIANHIMKLNPDGLALQKVVFSVLKKSKQYKKWDISCEWVDKINPENIDDTPIETNRGNTGWDYVSIWYLHKIRCLIHQGLYAEAVERVVFVLSKPNQKEKYFKRLQALAYLKQDKLNEAEAILHPLIQGRRVDWWILHDYANLLNKKGGKVQALHFMYKAAGSERRLEGILSLILDAAQLSKELNKIEESYYHFQLFKLIREKNSWSVPVQIEVVLQELIQKEGFSAQVSFYEALNKCQNYWGSSDSIQRNFQKSNRTIRRSLSGKLVNVKDGAPFCFIQSGAESFFCYVNDIPSPAAEGLLVQFDAIPSFDKKKNKESWKASNIIVC
ncbi:hypothetical protein [Neobacillus sp. NPDC093127]|uniref:hypothetical protein n=1 Tax=Neobacillus sp. NPDC093127 TaxID=3364296 RepID=UPI0037F191D5